MLLAQKDNRNDASEQRMINFLIHFYRKGSRPFRSLSALPEAEAVSTMKSLYVEGAVFWERFKDPYEYLCIRREVEKHLWSKFKEKGGCPQNDYPIYLVLGRPKWTMMVADAATLATTEEIQVPLSVLKEEEVSFTYPDSMVSALMVRQKDPGYYEPEYHGKVFTLKEMQQIIRKKGLPGEGWETHMPGHLAHYIEAQVWNQSTLNDYLTGFTTRSGSREGQ